MYSFPYTLNIDKAQYLVKSTFSASVIIILNYHLIAFFDNALFFLWNFYVALQISS